MSQYGKGWVKRAAVSAAAAVIICVAACFGGQPPQVSASDVKDMKSKQNRLTNDISSIRSQLNSTISDKNSTAYEVAYLDSEIEIAQLYYEYYCECYEWAVRELEILEEELAQARESYNRQYEAFCERIRYLNENDTMGTGYLSVLLSSSSFADFLNNAEIIKTLTEYDKTLVDDLKTAEEDMAAKLAEVEAYQQEAEQARIDQEIYLAELESKSIEKQQRLEELYAQEDKYNDMISDMEKDSKDLEKMIKDAEAAEAARQKAQNGNTQTVYAGGQLGWPVPSSSNVTSGFGPRKHPITKKNDYHNGIDISAPKGNDVVAAGDGKVTFAGTKGTYGKLVMIDHGNGITTLYAHNSSIIVTVGQSIVKGQTIAKIGSTGQSTGNHCHFEVRVNGVPQDPMGFVKSK